MKQLTRKKAKSKGLIKYFSNEKCKYGHLSERYTSSTTCVICSLLRNEKKKLRYRNDSEYRKKMIADSREWNKNNPDKVKVYRQKDNDRYRYDIEYRENKKATNKERYHINKGLDIE